MSCNISQLWERGGDGDNNNGEGLLAQDGDKSCARAAV